MSDEPPKGWARTTLGQICSKPQYGWTCRAAKNGKIKYLRTTDISEGKIDWQSVPYCEESPDDVEKYQVYPNDILVARAGSVGVSHRVQDTVHEAVFASYLIRFTALEGIEPRFIEFFFKSHEYWQAISDFAAGIAIPNVNATKLASLELPLAPLNGQKRIVAKLEKLVGKVDTCQQRLVKIPNILKRFRQSVLAAACSGRLTTDWRQEHPDSEPDNGGREFDLPGSWKFIEFGQLISDGPQNGLYKPAEFYGEGALIVRIDAFYDGTIAPWGTLKRIRLTEKERTQFSLRNDDILINRVNSPKFLGKAALVRKLTEPCVYESNMMRLRLDCSKVQSDYAILYFQSLPGLVELRKNAKHAVNQSSINQEDVKSAHFNLPPPAEQREIVRRVEAFFKLADQIEARFTKAKARVDQLTQSLLAKAFRGELVPQNPNDEPASVLLERIKAERTKGESEVKGGGKKRLNVNRKGKGG